MNAIKKLFARLAGSQKKKLASQTNQLEMLVAEIQQDAYDRALLEELLDIPPAMSSVPYRKGYDRARELRLRQQRLSEDDEA